MNNIVKNIMCAILLSIAMGVGLCLAGCDSVSLKIYQKESIAQIAPGNTLQISLDAKGLKENDKVEYQLKGGNGKSKISETGLLKADERETVGSELEICAKVGDVKSNILKIKVVDLVPSSIRLSSIKGDKIKVGGGELEISTIINPSYATVNDYKLEISKINGVAPTDANKNWAKIQDEKLIVDATAPAETVFTLNAFIVGHPEINSELNITVVETTPVDEILASDITIDANKDANKKVNISAFYCDDEVTNVDLKEFTYTSLDDTIATVDKDGNIIPKKHGSVKVEVRAVGLDEPAIFTIYVICAPTAIELNNVSTLITDKNEFSFSKVDNLKFNLKSVNTNYISSSAYTYNFEKINDDNSVSSMASNDIAIVDSDENITFKTTGKVRITIKSNSALDGADYSPSQITEATKVVTVDVNKGVNIRTLADLKNFAGNRNIEIANILTDLYLTADDNFGKQDDQKYKTLAFLGDTIIYGNGYKISLENLPYNGVSESTNGTGADFLHFVGVDTRTPFKVQLYDFSVIGHTDYNGIYIGNDAESKNKSVINQGNFLQSYRRGIVIYGGEFKDGNRSYVKDMMVSNVKVFGFDVGMRISHAVEGKMTDIEIKDCYSNGMEFNQNIITVNNLTLGQVGAFGIEMTPDDMTDKGSEKPKGTAGANYDQTAKLKLTGYIKSYNFNNGSSTNYMANYKMNGMSIPQVVDAILGGTINAVMQGYTDEATKPQRTAEITRVLNSCLKGVDASGVIGDAYNFYLLIFIDPTKFNGGHAGNTNNEFAIYDGVDEHQNVGSIRDILKALAGNANYVGYKAYQYLKLDLDASSLGLGNVGQVIMLNQLYDPNYQA